MQLDRGSKSLNSLLSMPSSVGACQHSVQFYESDVILAKVVGDFIGNGLGNGDAAVVIATPEHRTQLLVHLQAKGFNFQKILITGQLLLLDARTVMGTYMVNDLPDAEQFRATILPLLETASSAKANRQVRVYGEAVDLMCRDGNIAAAIAIEGLWNELAERINLARLCGYQMSSLGDPRDEYAYRAICAAHSDVFALPS